MGILSFFEQIGNLVTGIVDAVIFVIQSLVNFIATITFGFTFLHEFIAYLPGEITLGFLVLLSTAIIYLIVGR